MHSVLTLGAVLAFEMGIHLHGLLQLANEGRGHCRVCCSEVVHQLIIAIWIASVCVWEIISGEEGTEGSRGGTWPIGEEGR